MHTYKLYEVINIMDAHICKYVHSAFSLHSFVTSFLWKGKLAMTGRNK